MTKVSVKVIPRSSKNKIIWENDILKVKLTSPPVEGKANKELIRFLSKVFKIPKSEIRIVRGEKSRKKIIELNLPFEEIKLKLQEYK